MNANKMQTYTGFTGGAALLAMTSVYGQTPEQAAAVMALIKDPHPARDALANTIAARKESPTFLERLGDRFENASASINDGMRGWILDVAEGMPFAPPILTLAFIGFFESSKHGLLPPLFAGAAAT